MDAVLEQAIRADRMPGAVVWIGHRGEALYRKAYGNRSLEPAAEAMTLDTVFDAASLTKVIATTSAIMKLFEQGKVRLNDKVTEYLPEFQGGNSNITVRDLLTHFSGLRPDVDLQPEWKGYDTGVRLALIDKPIAAPGERFIYSDINFILLAEVVRQVTGEPLPVYVSKHVFQPLGMTQTRFQPPEAWKARIAPTEKLPRGTASLRGVVHDPTTRYMGGVAGHAGLFTTAGDLAIFAEMILNGGSRGDVRIFDPLTIRKFTTPQTPPNQAILRGLGWDIDSPFSGSRGELFPVGSFGHTGFTGTSLWLDPWSQTYVILMANSVHPRIRPAITSIRGRVATIAAQSLGVNRRSVEITSYNEAYFGSGLRTVVERQGKVLTGLDVLARDGFREFKGKRIGLITNHSGIDRTGLQNLIRMRQAGVNVAAIFSPEHGFLGEEDRENIQDSKEAATGIPIYSLYSLRGRRPTPEMIHSVDALVFDIQDAGARFYTYVTTMAYAMEEAAKAGKAFYVLDRPNPINGVAVEGPMLEEDLRSFIGYHPLPLRHGMTVGELARMFNTENKMGADLNVVLMEGWERGDWFDATNLRWVNPSPNLRSLNATLLYPGIAMLEASSNWSVGRGTDAPFEQVGAEWVDGQKLAAYLNLRKVPGVRAYPTAFTPEPGAKLAGKFLSGVRFVITGRDAFSSSRLGLELAAALTHLYPNRVEWEANEKLIGNRSVIRRLKNGEDPRRLYDSIQNELAEFASRRERYLLYR